jgi:hypothetical protein
MIDEVQKFINPKFYMSLSEPFKNDRTKALGKIFKLSSSSPKSVKR